LKDGMYLSIAYILAHTPFGRVILFS